MVFQPSRHETYLAIPWVFNAFYRIVCIYSGPLRLVQELVPGYTTGDHYAGQSSHPISIILHFLGGLDQTENKIQQTLSHCPVYMYYDGIYYIHCHRDMVSWTQLGILLVVLTMARFLNL